MEALETEQPLRASERPLRGSGPGRDRSTAVRQEAMKRKPEKPVYGERRGDAPGDPYHEAQCRACRRGARLESIGPEAWVNPVRRELRLRETEASSSPCRKGTGRKFPDWDSGASGDAVELGDVDGHPGESCLFFLTIETTLESVRPEIGWDDRQSTPLERRGVRSVAADP